MFDYPINVGGRPLISVPAFIPITFECVILMAAFGAFFGNIIMNRLPQPYHPVFNVPGFARASVDRFFLCIKADDPKFNDADTRAFLASLGAKEVTDVISYQLSVIISYQLSSVISVISYNLQSRLSNILCYLHHSCQFFYISNQNVF